MPVQVHELYARRNDPHKLALIDRQEPFTACDPGVHGALVNAVVERGHPRPVGVYALGKGSWADKVMAAGKQARELGAKRLVIEDVFLGKRRPDPPARRGLDAPATAKVGDNVSSFIKQVRNGGQIAGLWTSAFAGADHDVDIIYVPLQMWSHSPFGTPSATLKRISLQRAQDNLAQNPEFSAVPKIDKQGIADAWNIMRWWTWGR